MTDDEMRDAVAREVMGWEEWSSGLQPRGEPPDCWRTGRRRSPTFRKSGWNPQSDAGLAFEWVVPRMADLGWHHLNLRVTDGGGSAYAEFCRPSYQQEAYAKSAARAICAAALRAVRAEHATSTTIQP